MTRKQTIIKSILWRLLILAITAVMVAIIKNKIALVIMLNVVNMGVYYLFERLFLKITKYKKVIDIKYKKV